MFWHSTTSALLLILCTFSAVHAGEPKSIDQLTNWISSELHRIEVTTGGSPDKWQALEQKALEKLREFAASNPQSLVAPTKRGRTPVSNAAAAGHVFLVQALLKYENVRLTLHLADDNGFTAADRAVFALGQSLVSCAPKATQRVFVLVPHLARLPYYRHADPYPKITAILRQHKLVADVERVRKYWLDSCKSATPEVREVVEQADDLQAALISLDRKFWERKQPTGMRPKK